MGARAKLAHELALFNREIKSLKEAVYTSVCPLNAEYIVSHEPTPFDAAKNATYRPIEKGGKWGGFFDCGWFRFSAEIPYTASGKHLAAVIDVDGEGCVYDDGGAPVQGLTSLTGLDFPRPKGGVGSIAGLENHMQPIRAKKIVEISPYAEGGARVNLTVETSNNGWYGRNKGFARLKRAELVIVNDEIKDFYYDWATAFLFYLATDNPTRKKEIYTVLKAAAQAFLTGGESGLSEGKKLLKEGSDNNGMRRFTFFATGHAHLDLAWLWPIRETKRKAVRTYTAALKNIEKYPDYIFGSSQPQQYEWVKDAHPSVYANIKNAVESGRIEPQGGMWVEPDTNVPCGESLIRQVFYGKRFFADEFGKDVKVLWLPDVFGFSAQIPQIVKKTGMEYFLTIKLGWNEHNPFPLNSFLWEGLDGSRILAHIPPEGTYNSDAGPIAIDAAFKNNRDKDRTHVAHLPFGTGDGGGGPGEGELVVLK
ncbi:MAG: hypothetical protein LBT20_06780 [Clostridiales bacterium]|jgi:alpha-mannosidase|nr:hypothetical protein [Clostridiales bacterium]